VGVNEIGKWVKTAAEEIGMDTKKRKISNHSIRSTTVSSLAKAGVGEHQLIKITGHNIINSIKPYLQMDNEHHRTIVEKMRTTTSTTTTTELNNSREGEINITTIFAMDACACRACVLRCFRFLSSVPWDFWERIQHSCIGPVSSRLLFLVFFFSL
jgi:hypothetical protein